MRRHCTKNVKTTVLVEHEITIQEDKTLCGLACQFLQNLLLKDRCSLFGDRLKMCKKKGWYSRLPQCIKASEANEKYINRKGAA